MRKIILTPLILLAIGCHKEPHRLTPQSFPGPASPLCGTVMRQYIGNLFQGSTQVWMKDFDEEKKDTFFVFYIPNGTNNMIPSQGASDPVLSYTVDQATMTLTNVTGLPLQYNVATTIHECY